MTIYLYTYYNVIIALRFNERSVRNSTKNKTPVLVLDNIISVGRRITSALLLPFIHDITAPYTTRNYSRSPRLTTLLEYLCGHVVVVSALPHNNIIILSISIDDNLVVLFCMTIRVFQFRHNDDNAVKEKR